VFGVRKGRRAGKEETGCQLGRRALTKPESAQQLPERARPRNSAQPSWLTGAGSASKVV
jgi:hypothetical protein